jgi:hypothetical protein
MIAFNGFKTFEIVSQPGFVHGPQKSFNAAAFFNNALFSLLHQISDALPHPRATLKPTGIAVSIIIIARFPASFPVG